MMDKGIEVLIENVKSEMCDYYCRWPLAYKLEHEDANEALNACLKEKCEECPLNKL